MTTLWLTPPPLSGSEHSSPKVFDFNGKLTQEQCASVTLDPIFASGESLKAGAKQKTTNSASVECRED